MEVSEDGEVGRLLGEMVVADLASVSLDNERIISEAVARDGMRKVIAGEDSRDIVMIGASFKCNSCHRHRILSRIRSKMCQKAPTSCKTEVSS